MAARLRFAPVTRQTLDDFTALFEAPGGPKSCWCMVWRGTAADRRDQSGNARRRQMLSRIEAGVPVGLVGYLDGRAVAWVSVAPRETYRDLGSDVGDDGPGAWAIVCLYIRRSHRGEGFANEMIDAATQHACAAGARLIEAYPVDPDSPSYRFMGFVPAFERAGFTEIGRAGSRRHVMRLTPK